jgi:hypothetical protein
MSQEEESEPKIYKNSSSPGIEMKDFGKKKYVKNVKINPLVRTNSGGETQLGKSFPEDQKFSSQTGERPSSKFWQSTRENSSAKNGRRDVRNLKYFLEKAQRVSGNTSDAQLKGFILSNLMRYDPTDPTYLADNAKQSLERLLDDDYRSSVLEEISITNASPTETEGKGINLKKHRKHGFKNKTKKFVKKGRRFTKSKPISKSNKKGHRHHKHNHHKKQRSQKK